jgi:hypothetical protein
MAIYVGISIRRNRTRRVGVLVALLSAIAGGVRAETPPPPISVEQSAGQMPDAYKLNMMIRTTLIALNQANQTGNYSVLRDLGTPQFQTTNSDARLAEIFAGLRQRKLDLSPILFFDPKLVRPATVQENGLLRMTGYIDTRPERILFDMGFERVNGDWRLAAIVVDTSRPEAEQAPQNPAEELHAPAAAVGGKDKAAPKK